MTDENEIILSAVEKLTSIAQGTWKAIRNLESRIRILEDHLLARESVARSTGSESEKLAIPEEPEEFNFSEEGLVFNSAGIIVGTIAGPETASEGDD